MSLYIRDVTYHNFRNLKDRLLELSSGLTILVGRNAIGKTNCIEGIHLLTCGSTFRRLETTDDLILKGESAAFVGNHIVGDKRVVDVECHIEEGKKAFFINGKRRRAADCSKVLPAVLFNPDDLLVVKGAAAGRRNLVDTIGAQLNESYARVLGDYQRALTQRNLLLKADQVQGDLLEAWTGSLVSAGSTLYVYRRALVRRLTPHIVENYAALAPEEVMEVTYLPCRPCETVDRAQVADLFVNELKSSRDEEFRRRMTLVGPHRDDLGLTVDGRDVRLFGSQGQQRTAILAIKMAHASLVREILGYYPVFLLDDVMSELDASRRSALLTLIDGGMQTVVTTTNLDYFTAQEREGARVVEMVG